MKILLSLWCVVALSTAEYAYAQAPGSSGMSAPTALAEEDIRLMWSSVTGNIGIHCGPDTIQWFFNRPLPKAYTLPDNLIRMYRVMMDEFPPRTFPVACRSWIGDDRTIVYTLADTALPLSNQDYFYVEADVHLLPNTVHEKSVREIFDILGSYRVNFDARVEGAAGPTMIDVLYPAEELYANANSVFKESVAPVVDTLRFSHWEYPDDLIDDNLNVNNFTGHISFTLSCERMRTIQITAMYKVIPERRIDIQIDTAKIANVYITKGNWDGSEQDFTTPGVYGIREHDAEHMGVFLLTREGYRFTGWESDNGSVYNNNQSPYLYIKLTRNELQELDPITFLRATFAPVVGVPEPSVPTEASLQVFPSTVQDEATISYCTSSMSPTRVVIYDILGNTAAVVFDGMQSGGCHSLSFARHGLPGGLYICRVESGGNVQSCVIALL